MSSPFFRFVRVTGLSAVAAFIYGLVRSTQPKPTPPPSGTASWDPLNGDAPPPTRSGPVTFTADQAAEPADQTAAAAGEATDEADAGVVAPQGFVATATETTTEAEGESAGPGGWVEPDAEGGCPGSHPIKGNDQSKIFHVPGGMSYERTKAERCYCDEPSAEADGYRKAKR